jgi:hypothetical protein
MKLGTEWYVEQAEWTLIKGGLFSTIGVMILLKTKEKSKKKERKLREDVRGKKYDM